MHAEQHLCEWQHSFALSPVDAEHVFQDPLPREQGDALVSNVGSAVEHMEGGASAGRIRRSVAGHLLKVAADMLEEESLAHACHSVMVRMIENNVPRPFSFLNHPFPLSPVFPLTHITPYRYSPRR